VTCGRDTCWMLRFLEGRTDPRFFSGAPGVMLARSHLIAEFGPRPEAKPGTPTSRAQMVQRVGCRSERDASFSQFLRIEERLNGSSRFAAWTPTSYN
jgi:hypothetical protein